MTRPSRRLVISAFEELHRLGHLGRDCLHLVTRLVEEEARRVPEIRRDSARDLDDLVQEFLVDRIRPVTASLLAQATDDASVGRLLRRSVRNWMIDSVRKTSRGALRRRLVEVLSGDHAFEKVPASEPGAGRWRLTGAPLPPWTGPIDDLVRAAREVPNVRIPKWSSTTRRPPIADRPSIIAVAEAAFTAASGSLEEVQLVDVFAARFPVVLDPDIVYLPEGAENRADADEPTPEDLVVAADEELSAAAAAAGIVGMLSPVERRIVPYLASSADIRVLLACGPAQARQHADRVAAKLRQLVGEGEDREAVAKEVIRLCGTTTALG